MHFINFIVKKIITLLLSLAILLLLYPVGYYVLPINNNLPLDKIKSAQGIKAYIINLENKKARYQSTLNYVKELGLETERIEAVNGQALLDNQIATYLDKDSYKTYLKHLPKKGTIGCSLSHINTWKNFLQSNYEYALIFEDDISFDPKILKIAIDQLTSKAALWDINLFEIKHHGIPLEIATFANGQKLSLYLTEVTHAGAYIINRNAAIKLLQKALPIKMPVDHYFTRTWEFDIKLTGIENPRIVKQSFGDSNIKSTAFIEQENLNLMNYIKHVMFKWQSYVIRFMYNLKLYIEIKLDNLLHQ